MTGTDKVVARLRDGRLFKGHVKEFDPNAVELILIQLKNGKELRLPIDELKSLFLFIRWKATQATGSEKSSASVKAYGTRSTSASPMENRCSGL